MKKKLLIILLLIILVLFASCAAGSEKFEGSENVAGFWAGLWHGFISLITFIISIFNKNVEIYEVNNVGTWYNLGFILGVAIFFGSGSGSVNAKNNKTKQKKYKKDISENIKEDIIGNINKWISEVEEKKSGGNENICEDIEEKIKRDIRDWEY